MKVKGIVTSGRGEGKKFLSMEEYLNIFYREFNLKPYPGTLNVKVSKDIFNKIKSIGNKIEGFYKNGKYFGGFFYLKGRIKNIPVLVIIPELTRHEDIIEIVSEEHLRSLLKLKDGDFIIIEVYD